MKTETIVGKTNSETTRPPIVVVMGHIDHGKTTLLDAIRKTKVAEKESGGITQAIGAYQIEHHGKKITFIDTPGHEAFSSMRTRGAHVADVAVLVVAADEGLKPQTEEAMRIIRENKMPFVVAINKIDKPNADPDRVKKELADKEVLVEGYGGTVPAAEISAKTAEGVDNLLETILLLAELEELKSDLGKGAEGVVIESHLDPRRGSAATLLIEDGVVNRGDFIVIGGQMAPVRIFENFMGQSIESASASEPIRIVGFEKVPELGERFMVFKTRSEAEKQKAAKPQIETAASSASAPNRDQMVVNIILKTDVLGSKEAIESVLTKVTSPELSNRLLKSEVGDINESDVKLAAASRNTFIVGFKVKIPAAIKELADRNGVRIIVREIIYELVDEIKVTMLEMAPAEEKKVDLGKAKILALFKEEKNRQIVGGKVESGKAKRGGKFDIVRNNVKVGTGKIAGLQSHKNEAEEVAEGAEFGLLAEASISIAVGDILEIFTEEKSVPQI